MYCLKCGKDTKGEQIFCDACLQVMDAYPVKSDTPIHLPKRNNQQASPKKQTPRKKTISPEEQVQQLKAANRRLLLTVLSLIVALGICVGTLAYCLLNPQPQTTTPGSSGKNYTYSPD